MELINSVNRHRQLGWNNVLYNNLNTPNFAGGTPRHSTASVPQPEVGLLDQETVSGNNKTACVRWNASNSRTHVT
jgi:hypothetical protein